MMFFIHYIIVLSTFYYPFILFTFPLPQSLKGLFFNCKTVSVRIRHFFRNNFAVFNYFCTFAFVRMKGMNAVYSKKIFAV